MTKHQQIQQIRKVLGNRADEPKSTAEAFFSPQSREIELILHCCRASQADLDLQRIRELSQEPLNWPFIQSFVLREGIASLVYHRLKQVPDEVIPPDIKEAFSKEAWARASRSLCLAVELVKILKLFAASGIKAIPFKGPVLANTIYGDLRSRTSGDLDILIHRSDFTKAREVLLASGFSAQEIASHDEFTDLLAESKDFSFSRKDGIHIELHWEILPPSMPFLPAAESLWRETVKAPFLDATVLQFPPEVLFMLLCVHHGVSHFFELLIQVCDLDRFIKAYPAMDWPRVFEMSEQTDCTRAVLLGCLMAKMLLGTDLPPEITHRLQKDAAVQRLAADAINWRTQNGSKSIPLSDRLKLYLLIKRSWHGKLHLVNRLLLTDKRVDRQFVRLPASMRLFYLLIRPLRLLCGFLIGKNLKR